MLNSTEASTTKFILALLTIIAFSITALLWAVNSHSDIREWTSEQDFVTKKELKEVIKEQYVPLDRFVIVETKLDESRKENLRVMESLDEIKQQLRKISKKRKR